MLKLEAYEICPIDKTCEYRYDVDGICHGCKPNRDVPFVCDFYKPKDDYISCISDCLKEMREMS